MSEAKRRFLDRTAVTPTLISAGSRMQGDLLCSGDLVVAGSVEGRSQVAGLFTLADTGSWQGEVQCDHALIAGHIQGTLHVRHKLEIRHTARIAGRVSAQRVVIAEGAIVEADIVVLSGEPVQHFSEKRDA